MRTSRIARGLAVGLAFGTLPLHTAAGQPYDALDTKGGGIASRYIAHGKADLNNGRITEALSYSNRALALYPYFMAAYFLRGRAELAAGNAPAAIDDLTHVVLAHPEYPAVFYNRGEAYLQNRQPAAAIADLNQSFRAEAGAGSNLAANILSTRSLAFEMLGDGKSALADLEIALKSVTSDDRDWDVLNNRCYIAAVIGLLDSAQEACDESIARHTRNPDVYDSRGFTELKSGAYAAAIADYTKSLGYRPNLSLSLYGRALARRALGETDGAAADMAAATAADPNIASYMTQLGVTPSRRAISGKVVAGP